jgi:transcription antitermination factor NusG
MNAADLRMYLVFGGFIALAVVGCLGKWYFENYLPAWKDRRKKIAWPLFPGYCFTHIDPAESLPVLKCSGVVRLVSHEGLPAVIPDQEIEDIRTLVTSELQYDPCPLIKIGQMVEVIAGPLKGVSGRLIRKGGNERLVLSVNLIGQGVSVQIDASDIRPF